MCHYGQLWEIEASFSHCWQISLLPNWAKHDSFMNGFIYIVAVFGTIKYATFFNCGKQYQFLATAILQDMSLLAATGNNVVFQQF